MERKPEIEVDPNARRDTVNDRRHDLVRGPIVVVRWTRALRRPAIAVGGWRGDRPRQDEPQQPGRREVTMVGREPLDRHRDHQDAPTYSDRSPVRACHVRAFLTRMDFAPNPFGVGRIISRIRGLARRGLAGYGPFCVNDHEYAGRRTAFRDIQAPRSVPRRGPPRGVAMRDICVRRGFQADDALLRSRLHGGTGRGTCRPRGPRGRGEGPLRPLDEPSSATPPGDSTAGEPSRWPNRVPRHPRRRSFTSRRLAAR
jgi:hypothetical protein